jgi:hypothetical protein
MNGAMLMRFPEILRSEADRNQYSAVMPNAKHPSAPGRDASHWTDFLPPEPGRSCLACQKLFWVNRVALQLKRRHCSLSSYGGFSFSPFIAIMGIERRANRSRRLSGHRFDSVRRVSSSRAANIDKQRNDVCIP